MISAATAKTNTDTSVAALETDITAEQLESAEEQVVAAIANGQYSTWLDFNPRESTVQAIIALGYNLTRETNNGVKTWYISWDTLGPVTGDGDEDTEEYL